MGNNFCLKYGLAEGFYNLSLCFYYRKCSILFIDAAKKDKISYPGQSESQAQTGKSIVHKLTSEGDLDDF